MRELFDELIREAATGSVRVYNDDWPVGFNTKIMENGQEKVFYGNDRNLSMLYIKDEDKFFQKLEEYMEKELASNRKVLPNMTEKDKYKWILMYLWIYATTEDFLNPIEYIQKRIDFLEDHTFDELQDKMVVPLNDKINASIAIEQQTSSVAMETPKKLVIQLQHPTEEDIIYPLPTIYYAVHNENGKKTCYIYSLLKPKEVKDPSEKQIRFHKKMNRLLFKINDGVTNTEDYNIEGESNIKDVSMSFVFCLNIFISLLQKKGIEVIKAVPYLPVCYLAREITANNSSHSEELRERNRSIQENQTNKFIRTFRRLSAQNDALQVCTYPYEVDEFLTMILSPRTKQIENMLLEQSSKAITETSEKKGGLK